MGGTGKALARRASFGGRIINNAEDLLKFLDSTYKITKTFLVTGQQIQQAMQEFKLEERYIQMGKIVGVRSAHCVEASQDGKWLYLFELSGDAKHCSMIEVFEATEKLDVEDLSVADWVAAFYSKEWYYGKIDQVKISDVEFAVSFLKGKEANKNIFSYFEKQPTYVSLSQIICKITPPSVFLDKKITKYMFSQETLNTVISCISKRN